jgi:phosphoglycerate dehydrogenase-like enzyme
MALLLALARNIPQAHMSLTGGKWERSRFSGIELYEKTLGIFGFGRIGQLVAHRARGRDAALLDHHFVMHAAEVVAGHVAEEDVAAGRELQAQRAQSARACGFEFAHLLLLQRLLIDGQAIGP